MALPAKRRRQKPKSQQAVQISARRNAQMRRIRLTIDILRFAKR